MSASGPAAGAIDRLKAGGLVAFPTETVWGLAARAESAAGVERLRDWKGRRADQPVSLLVSGPEALEQLECEVSDAARALMAEFWPGALTLVLPCRHRFPAGVARHDGAVGVRCSSHTGAADLVREAERAGAGPLTATSLNRTGDLPARTRSEAAKLCAEGTAAPLLLECAQDAGGEAPSTVLDMTSQPPSVLRDGDLALEPTTWLAERGLLAADGDRP